MKLQVIDFFCGCGGTSAGLQKSGMEIKVGIDFDLDSMTTFTANFPGAAFIHKDIRAISFEELSAYVRPNDPNVVFCGCAPCQPFSNVNTTKKAKDDRVDLLTEFSRFIAHFRPAYVVVENVPGIQKLATVGPFPAFLDELRAGGYDYRYEVVFCHHYGVPQKRKRLVLIASRHGAAPWPAPTHGPGTSNYQFRTVWESIKDLPKIKAGETHPDVPNHRAAALSAENLKRIRATGRGKGRECWSADLALNCYKDHKGHTDVYGRMRKNQPAAALTTRCISLSNGRFGHPEQHRAISVREAACLQTFDMDFVFFGSLNSMARQIGNAVPVALANEIGKAIMAHYLNNKKELIHR